MEKARRASVRNMNTSCQRESTCATLLCVMKSAASADLHRNAIVIDGTCPLLRRKEFVDWYIEGGVTACAPTVGSTGSASETLRTLGSWHRLIASRDYFGQKKPAEKIVAGQKE